MLVQDFNSKQTINCAARVQGAIRNNAKEPIVEANLDAW
jgi:hypothetical protein